MQWSIELIVSIAISSAFSIVLLLLQMSGKNDVWIYAILLGIATVSGLIAALQLPWIYKPIFMPHKIWRIFLVSVVTIIAFGRFGVWIWPTAKLIPPPESPKPPIVKIPNEEKSKPTTETNKKNESYKGKQPIETPDLHKLFDKDFPNVIKIGADRKLGIKNESGEIFITIPEKEYQDYQSKSKFLGYFIPLSPHAYKICEYLSDLYKTTMDDFDKKGEFRFGLTTESNLTPSSDLIFSGRIYIYHENFFTLQELATLERLYKSKGLSVIFRGNTYLQSVWDSTH